MRMHQCNRDDRSFLEVLAGLLTARGPCTPLSATCLCIAASLRRFTSCYSVSQNSRTDKVPAGELCANNQCSSQPQFSARLDYRYRRTGTEISSLARSSAECRTDFAKCSVVNRAITNYVCIRNHSVIRNCFDVLSKLPGLAHCLHCKICNGGLA